MSLSNIKVNNLSIIGVDDEPTDNSENLVRSGGVASDLIELLNILNLEDGYVKIKHIPSSDNMSVEQKLINQEGGTRDFSSWHYSDFLRIKEGSTLKCKLTHGADIAYVAFYSEPNEQSFTESANLNIGIETVYTVPDSARYFRFSCHLIDNSYVEYIGYGKDSKRLVDVEENADEALINADTALTRLEHITDNLTENKTFLPGNISLTTSLFSQNRLFTSYKIAVDFVIGSFVNYVYIRKQSKINELTLFELSIQQDGECIQGTTIEILPVNDTMIDNSFGVEYVYKIPYGKVMNFIPCVSADSGLYFNLTSTQGGNGYVPLTVPSYKTYIQNLTSEKLDDVFFGLECESIINVTTLKNDVDNLKNNITVCATLNSFKNKKVGIIGDSISLGQFSAKSWGSILSEELGFTLYNESVAGYTLNNMLSLINNLPSNLDIIFVAGGANDFLNSTTQTLGNLFNIDTQTGKRTLNRDTSVCGRINEICITLRKKYPTAIIFLVTPPKVCLSETADGLVNSVYDKSISGDFYFEDMNKAFKDASLIHSMPIIDVCGEGIINSAISEMANVYYTHNWSSSGGQYADWGPDLTHPTTEGHKVIAKYIKGKLLTFSYLV